MKTSEQTDFLSIKDAYTLYEEGKKRRYGLLFTVNGGAFAIATPTVAGLVGERE